MKKKVVVLLLAMALSLGTTACTDQSGNGGETVSSSEDQSAGSQSDESGKNGSGEESGSQGQGDDQTGKPGDDKQVSQGEPKYLLSYGYEQVELDVLNSDGMTISKFDWPGFQEKCRAKGYDVNNATLDMICGDTVYFHQYEDMGDQYNSVVYAVKTDTFDIKKVFTTKSGYYFDGVDFYDGKLYIDCNKYEDGNSHFHEYVFEKDPSDLQFKQVTAENQALQDAVDSCASIYQYSVNTPTTNQNCSMARTLAENGFLLGQKDGRLLKIMEDGMIQFVPGFHESSFYPQAYDANYVIYTKYDEDWNSELYYLDLKTGEVKKVERTGSAPSDLDYLALKDGMLYFRETVSKDFILKDCDVCRIHLSDGNVKSLYQMSSVPGATTVEPGTQRFQFRDGKIYFEAVQGSEVKWMCYDENDNSGPKAIGTAEVISTFQYGSVVNDGYTMKCSFCGIDLEKYYGEAFQLDKKYSSYADKINEELLRGLKHTIEEHEKYLKEYTPSDDECEDHKEYPQMYCETVEDYVSNVKILSDKYLIVNTNGYWYGGGAHGQPYMGQYVFDLTTGERKGIKDFYQGTEKEFRELVARKTQEDFNSYSDEMSPYFADDEETIYNQAYEYADMNALTVSFEEKGIYVVYEPYMMGPFASGFIEVWISYEELLGRDQL